MINVEFIARMCHEANRVFCESIGDNSQVEWDDAPEWQKKSARNGVHFNIQNPDAPASASHVSWLIEKANDGWKYGPVKNADLKEHPCFLEYSQLPAEQRAKDHLFKAIVFALSPFRRSSTTAT